MSLGKNGTTTYQDSTQANSTLVILDSSFSPRPYVQPPSSAEFVTPKHPSGLSLLLTPTSITTGQDLTWSPPSRAFLPPVLPYFILADSLVACS